MRIFDAALAKMAGQPFLGPASFQGYLKENGLVGDTAKHISIDSLDRLAQELREARTMVFRLGSPRGIRFTQFALAQYVNDWKDYFLLDKELFAVPEQEFVPQISPRQLQAFRVLPKFTETSLVNLALASGLLSKALDLDDSFLASAPATGQGTYDFDFKPHEGLNTWSHIKGQVEIDAAIFAKRGGKETLFVVEAKKGPWCSLAKHKLLYPALALQQKVSDIPIVPVYLRGSRQQNQWHFYVAECSIARAADSCATLTGLVATSRVSHHVLSGFGAAR